MGSSPRVRGKRRRRPAHGPAGGLIPARAGKTGRGGRTSRRGSAHPRVCGENPSSASGPAIARGSSPRVRGKLDRHDDALARQRLIPACAGKTPTLRCAARTCAAHPRVCGENLVSTKGTAKSTGSSPRVRGKQVRERWAGGCVRLIPACAGKTRRGRGPLWCKWAHPRVCGENQEPRCDLPPQGGCPYVVCQVLGGGFVVGWGL